MEPGWEDELDVDDSDLRLYPAAVSGRTPPLRRPVLHPLLQPCSSQTPSPPPSLSQSQSSSPLVVDPTEIPAIVHASKRVIPGPAGAVQAAMHRRAVAAPPTGSSQTVLRVSQGNDGCDDLDFKGAPWRCALEFLGNGVDADVNFGVLSSISASRSTQRIPLVVGIIKSCKTNGLGDLIVSLKDLSGTLEATIHRKVVSESKFSGKIAVGSVMVLKQVVSFPTSRLAHYLNITLNNVVEVFSKDCESILIQKLPARWFKHAANSGGDAEDITAVSKTAASKDICNREIFSLTAEVASHGTESVEKIQSEVVEVRSDNPRDSNNNDMMVNAANQQILQNKRREPVSIVPHTNWTDEQLNELFADIEDW